jgi:phosphatidylserine/phosphatidylglycerophosphate/cardiolipin synthase-like enzyme
MVVDDQVAYIGGMNLRHVDWDSSAHEVYDWRREEFGAWDVTRTKVQNKERQPDTSPRKDYMVRIEGPAAQDAADIFKKRWDYLRDIKAKYSENSTPFDVSRDIAPRDGGLQVQVTATLPQPFWEHAIAETWFNAVRNAEHYIYIEDQYFRIPMLYDAIAAQMDAQPDLKLVVVTMGMGTWGPDCVQTAKSDEFFKARYPDRYTVFYLQSYDADTQTFVPIDTHSKMLVVDDFFMSVGSANKNNRGLIYEAELNVAVADPIVAQWRQRIAQNMLGDGIDVTDPAAWIQALHDTAVQNDAAFAAKGQGASPQGFAYTLALPSSSQCKLTSVGPDET